MRTRRSEDIMCIELPVLGFGRVSSGERQRECPGSIFTDADGVFGETGACSGSESALTRVLKSVMSAIIDQMINYSEDPSVYTLILHLLDVDFL